MLVMAGSLARRRCGTHSVPRRSRAMKPSATTMRDAQRPEEESGDEAKRD
jgi:hypothetical protein